MATAISQSVWGVMISEQKLYFIYQDGRVREFDIDIYNHTGDMLTDAVKLQHGRFSEDGEKFFCTAVLLNDCGDHSEGGAIYKAGNYHITVDVETLEVTQTWEPLPEGMFDQ